MCVAKTCILVTEICYLHLISRKEFCIVYISQFLLPFLITTTMVQAMALQGVLQKLQISETLVEGGREGGREGGKEGRGFEL